MIFTAIDHPLCKISEIGKAVESFEYLGFTTTPISRIHEMGIANQLIIFPSNSPTSLNFIELMTVTDSEKLRPEMGALLSGKDGIKSVVLSGPDSHAAHTVLNNLGFPFSPPIKVSRDWELPNKVVLKPSFSVLLPLEGRFRFNYCQYLNSEPYRRREWCRHENRTNRMAAIVGVSDDPKRAIMKFSEIFGHPPKQGADGLHCTSLGQVTLKIGAPDVVSSYFDESIVPGDRYVGLELNTAEYQGTKSFLESRIDNLSTRQNAIQINSKDNYGLPLVITPENSA